MRTQAVQAMCERYAVQPKRVREAMSTHIEDDIATLIIKSPRLSVSDEFEFAPKARRKRIVGLETLPITALIVKGRPSTLHRSAFIAGYRKGAPGVYWRTKGAPRKKVRRYKTVSVAQMLTEQEGTRILNNSLEMLEKRLYHEFELRLDKPPKYKSKSVKGKNIR